MQQRAAAQRTFPYSFWRLHCVHNGLMGTISYAVPQWALAAVLHDLVNQSRRIANQRGKATPCPRWNPVDRNRLPRSHRRHIAPVVALQADVERRVPLALDRQRAQHRPGHSDPAHLPGLSRSPLLPCAGARRHPPLRQWRVGNQAAVAVRLSADAALSVSLCAPRCQRTRGCLRDGLSGAYNLALLFGRRPPLRPDARALRPDDGELAERSEASERTHACADYPGCVACSHPQHPLLRHFAARSALGCRDLPHATAPASSTCPCLHPSAWERLESSSPFPS